MCLTFPSQLNVSFSNKKEHSTSLSRAPNITMLTYYATIKNKKQHSIFSVRYISAISPLSSISCSISSLTLSENMDWNIEKKFYKDRSKQKHHYDHTFTFWTLLVNATSLPNYQRRTRSMLMEIIFAVSSSCNG